MKKSLLIAICAVALTAMPAFAAVQNVKVSGDINSTWLIRNNFDMGAEATTGAAAATTHRAWHQNLFLTQTRLRVDADLTDNVSATVGLINERAWGAYTGNNSSDSVLINLAYVTLRQMLYSPLTVTIGRQNFAFGNSFIIDSAGTNNTASDGGLVQAAQDLTETTAQDAIRFTLDYNPLTIDMIYSKISNGSTTANLPGYAAANDTDLYGTNLNYKMGDKWGTVLEGYLWYKYANVKTSSNNAKADDVVLPGVHVSTNPIKGLNVQGELAFQFGQRYYSGSAIQGAQVKNQKRDAWATQEIVNYMLPFEKTAKYKPVLSGVYTFVSGDKNPANDNYKGWDPMFENQGGGTIYNALFNLTNANIVTLSAQVNPIKDVTTKVSYNNLWLAARLPDTGVNTSSNLISVEPDGSTAPTLNVNRGTRALGQELDVNVNYAYTEDVSLGLSAGWFFPGKIFASGNQNTANQVMGNVSVSF